MKIVIQGAGVAGLALAGLLQRQGRHEVTVLERRGVDASLGYGISLWPQGVRVLHALDAHDDFWQHAQPMTTFESWAGDRLLNRTEMPESFRRHGDIGTLPRGELVDLLRRHSGGVVVRHEVQVASWQRPTPPSPLHLSLSDGSSLEADLLIGADGMESAIRDRMGGRVGRRDTRWGCWVWWGPADLTDVVTAAERWLPRSFLGTYPCNGRVCVMLGAPAADVADGAAGGRRARIAEMVRAFGLDPAAWLRGVPGDEDDLFWWHLDDRRASHWIGDGVVLVGDAAAGFLPTAGVGASVALESAAVLADQLSRTDVAGLDEALALYERRRRPRVLEAQRPSRQLASLSFSTNPAATWLRRQVFSHVGVDRLVGPLVRQLRTPI